MSSGVQRRVVFGVTNTLAPMLDSDGKAVSINVFDCNWIGIHFYPADATFDEFQLQAKFGPGGDTDVGFGSTGQAWQDVITDFNAVGGAAGTTLSPNNLIIASTFPASSIGQSWAIMRVSGMSQIRFRVQDLSGTSSSHLLFISANN